MKLQTIIEQICSTAKCKKNDREKISTSIKDLILELDLANNAIVWDIICFRTKQLLLKLGVPHHQLVELDWFWQSKTEHSYAGSNLIYDPPRIYDMLLSHPESFHLLKSAFLRLREISSDSIRDDFIATVLKIRSQYRPVLTSREVDIFQKAIYTQTISPSKLAELIGTTKGYVSRKLQELCSRKILYEAIRFSYRALNLKVSIVLIEMDNLDAPLPIQVGHPNPWVHSIYDCKFGNRFILVNLIVPISWRSGSEIDDWRDLILSKKHVTDVRVFERNPNRSWMNYNYDRFSGTSWNIPPAYYGTSIRHGFEEEHIPLESQVPDLFLSGFEITNLDVKMIRLLFERGPLTVRTVREEVGKDYNFIRRRLNELQNRGIIWNRILPNPLFAPESIIMVAHINSSKHEKLSRALSCLPEIYAQRTHNGYTIFTLRMPEGYLAEVSNTLNGLLEGYERWLLQYSHQHFTNWSFPMERWKPGTNEWLISEHDFEGD
ncbi:MAG: hypothetical protein BAJATHORv1_130011 [Candidatus Thorarchaeota archaeon]|nr:MAG: hypothetical protein BAJATHORv1_130011 [Candidatus Thorarchaeota archaeon]